MGDATNISRRSFVAAGCAAGALALVGQPLPASAATIEDQTAAEEGAQIVWTHCHVNCGGACVLRCHVKDGKILYVETDNTGSPEFGEIQARACLRGRSIRRWIDNEERLNYPLRRVAGTKRGEGQYERISWDEAIDTIASEIKRIKDTYGNESIFIQECSGVEQNFVMNQPFFRLMNLIGGCVTRYGNYSNGSMSFGALPYTYGGDWASRSYKTLKQDELVVMFGNSPMDTRMGGDGAGYDLNVACEQKNVRVIVIDPRKSEVCTNRGAEWIPIVPGTDAALVAGIAHELIKSKLVDVEFLHKYCVGYDEETLPKGAPKNSSYYAYVMGTGYDKVEKTPAWAASITKIPEARIIQLAHEIGEAKPCFITQGWGIQRHANGDTAARAVLLLAQLVGQVGKPGTNSGAREGNHAMSMPCLPSGDNPIQVKFPNYLWVEAIENGPALTAKNAGIMNADKLPSSIKMLINYGNNMPANQNGDINYTTKVLEDELLCEFILCYDVMMTPSAKYADIILPDLTPQETYSMSAAGEFNDTLGLWMGNPIGDPVEERREVYEVCGEIAERLGVGEAYTEGKTREEWRHQLYDEMRKEYPQLPTYEKMQEQGIYKEPVEVTDETDPFIKDPEANPLETATGKIQIYSPELAELAKTWELPEGDVICPIPIYTPGFEGPDAVTDEYPLQVMCFHWRAHTHSTYFNNAVVQKSAANQLWMNPIDAAERGIADCDDVYVTTKRGQIQIQAKVTNRMMPGVVAMPEGMWRNADSTGLDKGGCINTLTSRHVNPVSKATGQHSNIGQVTKVGA